MSLLATKPVDLDEDFVYTGEVVKAEQLPDGGLRIIGVASGIEEDRDGERVSARGIAKMVAESQSLARKGQLPLTSSHVQDWVSEFGKVVALERDAETDQLLIDSHLPPKGVDPIADKARLAYEQGKKLGFSIGGKLRSAFHEIDQETGKRRRVLDHIQLRHVMLTEHPSYDRSFAVAVGKSFTGEPADEEFVVPVDRAADRAAAAEIIAKAAKPQDDEPDGDEPQAPAAPAAAAAPPPAAEPADAGQGDATAPGTPGDAPTPPAAGGDAQASGEPSDAEMAAGLPMARHLSCPNCGHEFAADLPDAEVDNADSAADDDGDDDASTNKTTEPNQMSDTNVLAQIRELVQGSAVAKATPDPRTPDPAAAAGQDDVMKTVQTIAAGLVATHEQTSTAIAGLEAKTDAINESVTKALQGLVDVIAARPQGRRSLARILPARGEVEKSELDEETDVAKAVSDAPSAQAAMRELNKRNPAYAHHYDNAA